MSSREERSDAPDREAMARLEGAVGAALDRIEELRGRMREAERRGRELESLLERFDTGEETPGRLLERLAALESENEEVRRRLEEGREAVERLLSRIRFLEEQE